MVRFIHITCSIYRLMYCHSASMIAMLVVGGVLIPVFVFWDFRIAKYPVIAPRFCVNRSVVIACLIGAFDFVSRSYYLLALY
jgi:hypothetical protein